MFDDLSEELREKYTNAAKKMATKAVLEDGIEYQHLSSFFLALALTCIHADIGMGYLSPSNACGMLDRAREIVNKMEKS